MIPLFEKALRAFLIAFLGVFLTGVLSIASGVANTHDWSGVTSALLGLVAGALAAGVRILVAYLPLFADDNNHGIPTGRG